MDVIHRPITEIKAYLTGSYWRVWGTKPATGRENNLKYWEGKNFNLWHFFTGINICFDPVNEKDATLS